MRATRREFLAVASGAAAAVAATRKPVVAGHPWVWAALRPDRNLFDQHDQIFADFRAAGLDEIELMMFSFRRDDAVRQLSELIRKHNLPLLGMTYSANMWNAAEHDAILADAGLLIPRVGRLGGRRMGTTVGTTGKRKTPEQLDAQAKLVRKLMSMCGDHGIELNLHNHIYEVNDGEYDLRGTLERVPEVKLGPDLNWLVRAGVDPVDFIRRHRNRIVFAHLRDQAANGRWVEAMGEGATDYRAIGRAFHEIGFAGDFSVELAHEKDFQTTRPLRESFRLSREYVRSTMGY